ncbi:MAG: hypothetical protein PVSMB8_06950 [Vulcanimicrobiaceae bacterium]
MDVAPDRIASVEVVAALGFALLLAVPRKRAEHDDAIAGMQAVILSVEDYGRTRTVRLGTPITIGRSPHATLVVSDAQVSRLHARIDSSEGTYSVRDLDSRNGTLVNARPIDGPTFLEPGDEIDVGTTRIRFDGVGAWK